MRAALILLLLLLPAANAQKWEMSYFYDHLREVLHFTDFAFPSPDRGIAVGTVVDEAKLSIKRHVAVLTSDGGKQWTEVPLSEAPVSLFFLDQTTGWMVTDKGLWKTDEAGRSWRRVSKQKNMQRVWFLDENHGFAIGEQNLFSETKDGGKRWTAIKFNYAGMGDMQATFQHVAFVNSRVGMVIGEAATVRRKNVRYRPRRLLVQLETRDGGATWKSSTTETTSHILDLKLRGTEGLGVLNIEFRSSLLRINLQTGQSTSVYKTEDLRATSALLLHGQSFMAGVAKQTRGLSLRNAFGKIRIFGSTDLTKWTEIPVDYRAEGTWAFLAGTDPEHVFLATDQGMILRFNPAPTPRR